MHNNLAVLVHVRNREGKSLVAIPPLALCHDHMPLFFLPTQDGIIRDGDLLRYPKGRLGTRG